MIAYCKGYTFALLDHDLFLLSSLPFFLCFSPPTPPSFNSLLLPLTLAFHSSSLPCPLAKLWTGKYGWQQVPACPLLYTGFWAQHAFGQAGGELREAGWPSGDGHMGGVAHVLTIGGQRIRNRRRGLTPLNEITATRNWTWKQVPIRTDPSFKEKHCFPECPYMAAYLKFFKCRNVSTFT